MILFEVDHTNLGVIEAEGLTNYVIICGMAAKPVNLVFEPSGFDMAVVSTSLVAADFLPLLRLRLQPRNGGSLGRWQRYFCCKSCPNEPEHRKTFTL